MKLSSAEIMMNYQRKLKQLRTARTACRDGVGGARSCYTSFCGETIDFIKLVGSREIMEAVGSLLDAEIAKIIHEIEAHGVVVDE
jgi:hypothetical protein